MTKKQKKLLIRIIIAAVLMIILHFLPIFGWIRFCLYLMPYLIIGYDILKKAAKGIINRQVFDENFLMALATIGAIIIAVSGKGDYTEAVAVMLFYQIGELFQSYAIGKSRKNISQLMDIRPDYANIETDGHLMQVDPEEVDIGTIIVVQPGEKIPIDGIIIAGRSSLNTSALTGESIPRDVSEGCEAISGCINMTGVLKIRTTREFCMSTVSRILDLVENAASRKSKSEQFISRFARIYTPFVCGCAVALAVLPPLLSVLFFNLPPMWGSWFYRALTFLVISCPCALVISIPLTFFAGIGGAGNAGILIKGSNYLEALSKASCVVFDKTGTLTKGSFEVTSIHAISIKENALLEYAALAEVASSHPIGLSLQKAYGAALDRSRVTDLQEVSGEGIIAQVDSALVAVGNQRLMKRMHVNCGSTQLPIGTIVHVAINKQYAGYIVISDAVKPTSGPALQALKSSGIPRLIMLTGDSRSVAEKTAQELGIEEVYSELLPQDKVTQIERLLNSLHGKTTLAFVGDGVNDAPVLSRSDVGIAMGAIGSDAAIEAADVVLMDDNPLKVSKAIRISKKCMRIVRQNIVFSLSIKAICLILGAIGVADMWLAIFADVGVMVIAVLNAIRALYVRNL